MNEILNKMKDILEGISNKYHFMIDTVNGNIVLLIQKKFILEFFLSYDGLRVLYIAKRNNLEYYQYAITDYLVDSFVRMTEKKLVL
jgi:hypothetical protein